MIKMPLPPNRELTKITQTFVREQVFDYPINDPLPVPKVKFKHLVPILKTGSY